MTPRRHLARALSLVVFTTLGTAASSPAASYPPLVLTHYGSLTDESLKPAQSWNEEPIDRGAAAVQPAPQIGRLSVVRRAAYLWVIFTPLLTTAVPALYLEAFRVHAWYPLACWTLARGGAAWIKWAQWASTRPDILPERLCYQLAKLQTAAPAHSLSHSRREVEHTFGMRLEDVFETFDPNPVASGSIAQVHFATYQGQRVAVKVRHPNVAEQLSIDFRLMKLAAEMVELVPGLQWLNLQESVRAFSHTMTGQTFLDIEGNHLALLNHNFRYWKDVSFPRPLVASEAVLVESFEDGRLVSDFTGMRESGLVASGASGAEGGAAAATPVAAGGGFGGRRQHHHQQHQHQQQQQQQQHHQQHHQPAASTLGTAARLPPSVAHFVVTRGEDLYLKMLLTDGLMHADLHPGNILVSYDKAAGGAQGASITLVDAGNPLGHCCTRFCCSLPGFASSYCRRRNGREPQEVRAGALRGAVMRHGRWRR